MNLAPASEEIKESIISKIRCANCRRSNLVVELVTDFEGRISCPYCNATYPIRRGILFLADPKASDWDRIYETPIRGNLARTLNDHIKLIEKALREERSLLSYFILAHLAKKTIARSRDSIEIGCGSGTYSLILKKLKIASTSYLVDRSLNALLNAQRIFSIFDEKAIYVLGDALNLPFKENAFDLAFSGGLIEHFKYKEQQRIISEHCRLANRILCQVPTNSIPYWIQRMGLTLLNKRWPFGYERPLSQSTLKKYFKNSGFVVKSFMYHDPLTAFLFRASIRHPWIGGLASKHFLNRLLKHEVVVYAQKGMV